MRRLLIPTILLISACGSWQRVGSDHTPPPEEQAITQLVDMPGVFRKMGRLATGQPLPFVGTVALVAGPADSALAVVALSLESKSFTFTKSGNDFTATYRIEIVATRQGAPPVRLAQDEAIRVRTFAETQRADESLLFQKALKLVPGRYGLTVTLTDGSSARQAEAAESLFVPAFTPGTLSAAFFTYQVKGRGMRTEPLAAIINPRGTAAFGGDTLLAYVEGYEMPGPRKVPFELRDERDSTVLLGNLAFAGGLPLEAHAIRIKSDSVPLGILHLVVDPGANQRVTGLLVSLSSAWLVTNYDEMITLLRYFGSTDQLAALKKASAAERPALWRKFWHDTDPNPSTPQNEAIEEYFNRLASANQQFKGEGMPGWRTDRGEVFITLGPPDEIYDETPQGNAREIRWIYNQAQITLYFDDPNGYGRYLMTPSSRAQFDPVAARVRRSGLR
ncbi:MAG: GWxTD domain-containing protein [Gemmatimonadota bacterium]